MSRPTQPDRPGTAALTLVDVLAAVSTDSDAGQIERAHAAATAWHDGQWRKSGDPFISHPLAVAFIVAEMGLGTAAVCAALLHDVIEDTPCTLALLRNQFGDDVADTVDQVTQLSTFGLATPIGPGRQHALVIKLADRLHNMRTVSYIPPEKQQRKSREVLDYFAPLANALGFEEIGSELVGLATAVLSVPGNLATAAPVTGRRDPGLSRQLLAGQCRRPPASARP